MSIPVYYLNAAPPRVCAQPFYVMLVPGCRTFQCGPVQVLMRSAHVCGSGTLGQGGGILPVDQTLRVDNDNDDPFDEYLKDPEDPSIRVDKLTLKNQNSTPEQCKQFVNLVQKTQGSRAGSYIKKMSIFVSCCQEPMQKIKKLAELNKDSQWLNGDEHCTNTAAREYDKNDYKLQQALTKFDGNKDPVLEQLGTMLEWFMEFFVHRQQENWKSEQIDKFGKMEDEITYWHKYFNVLKHLALGFGFEEAYFKDFCTWCKPTPAAADAPAQKRRSATPPAAADAPAQKQQRATPLAAADALRLVPDVE